MNIYSCIIGYVMPKSTNIMPSLQRRLKELGENIQLARLRRRLPATQIAERAGLSRQTLSAIEHGDPSVTIGAYASVLLVLGLDADLTLVAADDVLGRKLQDADLTVKQRAPRRPKSAFQPLSIDITGEAGNKE
jgi:transcriptional regulator with XRE-family HTH domain